VQRGEKPGFPKFRSRKRGIGSFRVWGRIHVECGRIKLPRIGWLRLKEKGYLPYCGDAEIKVLSATVCERAGRWFVSLQVEEEIQEQVAAGPAVGVDLGIACLVTTSDGRLFANPRALQKSLERLARLNRQLHRRQLGSRNRAKTRARIARLYQRIASLRQDTLHQTTTAIVARTKPDSERPAAVVLEDLNVQGMGQNRKLAQAITDAGMGEFRRQITYKCCWYGSQLIQADRWYPSSKMCSRCGLVKAELRLSERVYRCPACGLMMDRDLNAAQNLAQLATGSSPGSNACGDGEVHSPV
jgi:putative transposase